MPTTIPKTTSTARASLSPSAGDAYFETDTKNYIIYDGTNWRIFNPDSFSSGSFSNNYVFDFGGTDEYLTSSPVTPNATEGTVSAWVKYSGGEALQIFSWSNITTTDTIRLMFGTSGSGNLRVLFYNTSGQAYEGVGGTQINDGNWHHVVFTGNGTTWGIWLDGVEETVTFGGQASGNKGDWVGVISNNIDFSDIGAARRSTGGSFSVGKIDEVAIWDSVLTEPNIADIYGNGTPNDISALSVAHPKAWYRMGDGEGDSWDASASIWTIKNKGDVTGLDMLSQNMEEADRVQEALIVT